MTVRIVLHGHKQQQHSSRSSSNPTTNRNVVVVRRTFSFQSNRNQFGTWCPTKARPLVCRNVAKNHPDRVQVFRAGYGRGLSLFLSLVSNQEEEAKKDPDEEEDEDVRKEQEKKFPRSSDSGSRGAPIGTLAADPCAPTVDSIQRTTDRRNSYQRPSKKAWKQPWEKKTTIGTTRIQIQVLTVVLVVKRKHP